MAIIKLSKNERRRLSVFFTCIVLAFGAWVLTMLSQNTPYMVKVALTYNNAPIRKSFKPLQADSVEVTTQGSGWDFLFSAMQLTNRSIPVSLKSLDNHNYVVLSSQLSDIRKKWPGNEQIISFDPDTLYFDFTPRAVKKVPVQLQSKLTFAHQYSMSDRPLIKPDYITVTGPANVIANITSWKTDSLILRNVSDTVLKTMAVQKVTESNLSIYPKMVQVQIPVDEYTEKTLEIPVKLINNKNYYNVKVFPKKVKIIFTVALNKYAVTNEDAFDAVADLNLWHDKGYHQLPVTMQRIPPYCKIVRIEPQNLDFIINQ